MDFWGVALPGYATGAGTLVLAFFTWRAVKQGQVERRDRLDFEQRSQARSVIVAEAKMSGTGEGPSAEYLNCTYQVTLTNNGAEPIMAPRFTLTVEPSSAVYGDSVQSITGPRVMPGVPYLATFYVVIHRDLASHLGFALESHTASVEVDFTDSAGYRWRRTRDHLLELVSAPT